MLKRFWGVRNPLPTTTKMFNKNYFLIHLWIAKHTKKEIIG